jgi:hypothetical protein
MSWQLMGVVLVFLLALAYVSHRAWLRLSSLTSKKNSGSSCASGCGCGPSASAKVHSISR